MEAALAQLYSLHNALMHFTLRASLPTSTMVVSPAQFAVHIGHNYLVIQNLTVLSMATSLTQFSRSLMTQLLVFGCIGAPFFALLAMMMMIQLSRIAHQTIYVFIYLYYLFNSLILLLFISSQVKFQVGNLCNLCKIFTAASLDYILLSFAGRISRTSCRSCAETICMCIFHQSLSLCEISTSTGN